MKRNHGRHRAGLTLLELMIVLVILVGLLYAVDMRTFPGTEDGLQVLLKPPADEKKARKWDGPYLDDEIIPGDSWDSDFVYEYPPTKGTRDFPNIFSSGPDGEPNTDDDITNWRESTEEGDAGDDPVSQDE
jgi:prepilin-type N-terminal cleavage/methylation domain-containing protein